MFPNPNAQASVISRLAEYFTTHQQLIIAEWCRRVTADPALPTVELSERALLDHVPLILKDLTQTLRQYGSMAVAEQSGADAEEHGKERWKQGFSLTHLLREFHHLRAVLTEYLSSFEEMNPDFALAPRTFALSTVNRFLDAMMTESCEQFVTRQNSAFQEVANRAAPPQ